MKCQNMPSTRCIHCSVKMFIRHHRALQCRTPKTPNTTLDIQNTIRNSFNTRAHRLLRPQQLYRCTPTHPRGRLPNGSRPGPRGLLEAAAGGKRLEGLGRARLREVPGLDLVPRAPARSRRGKHVSDCAQHCFDAEKCLKHQNHLIPSIPVCNIATYAFERSAGTALKTVTRR